MKVHSVTERTRFCPQCGAEAGPGIRFCEQCGNALTPQNEESRKPAPVAAKDGQTGRGRRVVMAAGMVAAAALVLGALVFLFGEKGEPPAPEPELPSGDEAFPVQPVGVDSINNTIDGKKVAIEGDGNVMNSPGLGVNRPVWCLNGPTQSVFTVAVGKTSQEGTGTLSPGFQVLLPVLREEVETPKKAIIQISLIDAEGNSEDKEFRLTAENRWQPLEAGFVYDSQKAPHTLRFEATGFDGALYIDRVAPAAPQP